MSYLIKIKEYLSSRNIPYLKDYNMKYNSYSRTGGIVKILIMPSDINQLQEIIKYLNNLVVEYKIVGETTNVLFLDTVEYSIFISTKLLTSVRFTDDYVNVETGKSLPDFVRDLAMREYSGLEGLEGIPGSVGGAIFMNAGAYGYSISDLLLNVHCLDENGDKISFQKRDLKFERRWSTFKDNNKLIVLSADFSLIKGKSENIAEKIEVYHIARHLYQEWVYPNLGSIYSADKSIYDVVKYKKTYFLKLKLIRKIFFNRVAVLFKRKKPSNKRINELFAREFDLSFAKNMYSHKNINTFTNKNHTTKDIMNYIHSLGQVLNDNAKLENELVNTSIYKILNNEDFSQTIKKYNSLIKG